MAKKQRHHLPPRQTRTRSRGNKSTLASDPLQNTTLLNDQLRSLGLYPAPTLGDGNCLFRALSDQFYGSPSQHLKLRDEICNWMEGHKARYAPFCEDERGLDVHLRCMRQPGTYGGHLELTAFAHLKRRDVKVIQPGLVYVIEWTSGADLSPTLGSMPSLQNEHSEDEGDEARLVGEKEARKTRRERKQEMRARARAKAQAEAQLQMMEEDESSSSLGAVYVAYHDWEHFSSVRNLTGPHAGLPYVVEKPATTAQEKAAARAQKSAKPESQSSQSSLSIESSELTDIDQDEDMEQRADTEDEAKQDDGMNEDVADQTGSLLSPITVPLPMSRTPSPPPSSETSASQSASVSGSSQSQFTTTLARNGLPLLPGYNCPPDYASARIRLRLKEGRGSMSPKRAYNGNGDEGEDSQGEAKRSRRNSFVGTSSKPSSRTSTGGKLGRMTIGGEKDGDDGDTPDLSSAESSSNDHSSSPAMTPPPSTVVIPPTPNMPPSALSPSPSSPAHIASVGKTMTKRQRKRLGLPKSQYENDAGAVSDVRVDGGGMGTRVSAGKIKVPGGRFRKPGAGDVTGRGSGVKEGEDEWVKNGSGRVDVRGFKELKI